MPMMASMAVTGCQCLRGTSIEHCLPLSHSILGADKVVGNTSLFLSVCKALTKALDPLDAQLLVLTGISPSLGIVLLDDHHHSEGMCLLLWASAKATTGVAGLVVGLVVLSTHLDLVLLEPRLFQGPAAFLYQGHCFLGLVFSIFQGPSSPPHSFPAQPIAHSPWRCSRGSSSTSCSSMAARADCPWSRRRRSSSVHWFRSFCATLDIVPLEGWGDHVPLGRGQPSIL